MAEGSVTQLRDTKAPLDDPGPPVRAFNRTRYIRLTLLLVVPLIALIAGAYVYATGGRYVSTDNAYVKADKVALTTDVSGIVREIPVHDNDQVSAGQVLFRLDDEPFRLALARADAQLNVVRNDIETQKASYRQKQEELKLAQTDIDFYQRDFNRQQMLVARNNASEARFDEARHNLDSARQRYAAAKQELAALAAGLNGDPNIAVEQHPRYRDAVARRDQAQRDLDHTVVRAPYAGIVTNVPSLQPGMYLQASTPAFSVVATDHVWIEANPKETDLTYVRAGQTVTVSVDTYPDVEFHGTVASLSPASGAEFSLLPAQNTSGNWVKVVQRIPLRVRLDIAPNQPPLRAGMSVIVEIDTGHSRGLPLVVKSAIAAVKG
jgi:membrane fusion protein (multidrug efflux system)